MKQTEIIAQLRNLRESQADFAKTNGDEIYKRDVEALDAAIEVLERIRWRKVGGKDRPPEENTPVLICTRRRDVWMASYYSECRIAQKLFIPAYWDVETLRGGGIDCKATEVTHWMPLPEPPKGGNDES